MTKIEGYVKRVLWGIKNKKKLAAWADTAIVLELRRIGLINARPNCADTTKQIEFVKELRKQLLYATNVSKNVRSKV